MTLFAQGYLQKIKKDILIGCTLMYLELVNHLLHIIWKILVICIFMVLHIFLKNFISKRLFSDFLDNKEGEDVSWSLRIRNKCLAKSSSNIILRVKRKATDNPVLTNIFFKENNKK